MSDTVSLQVPAHYAVLVKCQRGRSARRPFLDIHPASASQATIAEGQEHFILALPIESELKIKSLSNAGASQCREAGSAQSSLRREHGYDEHVITRSFQVEDKDDGDWDDASFTVEFFRRLDKPLKKGGDAPAGG